MLIPLALAASLLLAEASAAEPAAPPAAEAPAPETLPMGAPADDYQFVAWCYGVLSGYLELHDQVMPEVTRIESTYRRPGAKLEDDLKVYADEQRQAEADLRRLQAAMTAAEKASIKAINVQGAAAMQRGRAVWNGGPDVTKARLAREWMSWTLPARCPATAEALEKRANLLGASLRAGAETQAATPAEAPPPKPN
jgi:hypothetical protein